MPELPTITVSQPQFDKLLSTFEDAATYKAWLRRAVVAEAKRVNSNQLIARDNAKRKQEEKDFEDTLLPETE